MIITKYIFNIKNKIDIYVKSTIKKINYKFSNCKSCIIYLFCHNSFIFIKKNIKNKDTKNNNIDVVHKIYSRSSYINKKDTKNNNNIDVVHKIYSRSSSIFINKKDNNENIVNKDIQINLNNIQIQENYYNDNSLFIDKNDEKDQWVNI